MNSYNYTGAQPSPQMLGAAMMPMDVQNAGSPQSVSSMGGVPQMNPQQLQAMMGTGQFSPGYQDSAGINGNTLNSAGIAPGNGGGGIMGLNTSQMMNGGGNPLGLSSGYQFSPNDITALQGAFGNG